MLCETGTIKCEKKKKKESPNLTKELSYVILKPHIVRVELSNVRKKKVRGPPNVKKTVTCDVETAQCEDETIKCEKKVREPPNVRKELSYVILKPHTLKIEPLNVIKELSYVILKPHNVRIELSNVRRKKSKGTTKCGKKNCHM